MFAAHDTADGLEPVVVGNHHIVWTELVFTLIEGKDRFAFFRASHDEIALDFRRIEDVHRAALIEGHVVGNVDQCVDRAQADCQQALLHPLRAGAILHAAHDAKRKARAESRIIKLQLDIDRRCALDLEARCRPRLQRAETGGRQITCDAIDRGAIRTVRREVDLDDRIIKPGIGRERRADRRIFRQIDDAIVIVGYVEFLFGTHHAVAFDTADLADGKRHIDARNISPRTRQGANEAGARIWRPANDLHRLAVTGIHRQHLQAIRFRMLFRRQNLGDDEGLVSRLVVDILDLETDCRQSFADLLQRGIRIEMLF